MAYDLSTRLDVLGTRMKDLNQTTLSYVRGATAITVTSPTLGKVDVNQLAAYGIVLVTEKLQDFIFDTSDLSTLTPALPKIGDKIVWDGNTYLVSSFGEEVFTYMTSSRNRIRVHTKQTAA